MISVCVRHYKLKSKEYHNVYMQCLYLNVLGLACLQYVHVAVCMLISVSLTQLSEKSPRPVAITLT